MSTAPSVRRGGCRIGRAGTGPLLPATDLLGLRLADIVPDAAVDPWLLVDAFGDTCLFGYALFHPLTDGLSWTLSTPVLSFDGQRGRARTASGRLYALGRRIQVQDLDEEGIAALRLLVHHPDGRDPTSDRDRLWLVARKMSRHLGGPAPCRDDLPALARFIVSRARWCVTVIERKRSSP